MTEDKRAPVQGWAAGIPWDLHLEAYSAYCKRYGPQKALIEGGCRGGFHTNELDVFLPGWRERISAIAVVTGQRDKLAEAARELIDQADLTCMRANEEISVAEGCPCPVCVLRRLSLCGLTGTKDVK